MKTIQTICPNCRAAIEIPDYDFDSIVCAGCGAAYTVQRGEGAVALRRQEPATSASDRRASRPAAILQSRLAELDEFIQEARAEIEAITSREQSAPLQLGCAFFGLFLTTVAALVVFMLLGKSYVGGLLFYLAVSGVLVVGILRIRRKIINRPENEKLRQERTELETDLARMEHERARLLQLRAGLE